MTVTADPAPSPSAAYSRLLPRVVAAPARCRWCSGPAGTAEIEFGWYSAVLARVLHDLDPREVAVYGVDDAVSDDLLFAATCRGTGDRPVLEFTARALALAPAAVTALPVVDVGAGTGGPAAWLQARTGRRVLAVEPSAASLATGRELFPALESVRAEAESLPVSSGSVGAVTMLGVLSLVDDAAAVLREARRVSATGGILVITDYAAPDAAARRRARLPEGTSPEVGDELLAALADTGWDVAHVMPGAALPDRSWTACRDAVDSAIARHVGLTSHGADDACPVAHEAELRARSEFSAAIEKGAVRRITVVARAR